MSSGVVLNMPQPTAGGIGCKTEERRVAEPDLGPQPLLQDDTPRLLLDGLAHELEHQGGARGPQSRLVVLVIFTAPSSVTAAERIGAAELRARHSIDVLPLVFADRFEAARLRLEADRLAGLAPFSTTEFSTTTVPLTRT